MAKATNFIHQNHMPTSVREICDALGIKSSSVFDLLQALERKDYISERRKARSIVILDCKAEHSLPADGERHGLRKT